MYTCKKNWNITKRGGYNHKLVSDCFFPCRYNDRVAVCDATLRKHLLDCNMIGIRTVAAEKGYHWLMPLVDLLSSSAEDSLPAPWERLLKDLGSTTPVIGIFDLSNGGLHTLKNFAQHGIATSDDLALLRRTAPVIFNVIKHYGSPHVNKLIQDLTLHLLTKVHMLLEVKPHQRAAYVTKPENDPLLGLPVRYLRGAFAKDSKVISQYRLS